MSGLKGGRVALEAIALLFVIALIAGQVVGQPVLLSYVETDSMEPTLEPNDGFVAVPAALTDSPDEGDVIVFTAEELHGGGLTTHRVVEVTDSGYVTKGDANPFTDQDGDEPVVKDAQVVAEAWQPGTSVLVLPGVGTVVTGTQSVLERVQRHVGAALGTRSLLGTQGLAYFLFAASIVLYLVDTWVSSGTERGRKRDRSRDSGTSKRLFIVGATGLVVLTATAAMVGPAGAEKIGFVSAESDAPGPSVVERNTTETVQYAVSNDGFIPVAVFFESKTERVTVEPRTFVVHDRSTANTTLTISAPPETGYYRQYVVEHRYLRILPTSVLRTLYGIHPWVPIVVIDGILGGSFFLLSRAIFGTGNLRSRDRDRSPSAAGRL